MLFRVILWAFIIGMVFRFIFRFVFPIVQITKVTQDRLRQMQKQMEDMHQQQPKSNQKEQAIEGDYIDYEEVK